MSEDPGFWEKAVNYLGGIALALAGVVWHENKRRVEQVEKAIIAKADKDELDRNRADIRALYDGQARIRQEMNDGFSSVRGLIHDAHIDLLERIGK